MIFIGKMPWRQIIDLRINLKQAKGILALDPILNGVPVVACTHPTLAKALLDSETKLMGVPIWIGLYADYLSNY